MIQIHQLKPIHKPTKQKRIGRGGKRGNFSGRGQKGQRSRAGRKFKPNIRELIKKYPKLRGYRQKHQAKNLKLKTAILNIEVLEKKFETGDKITPAILLEKKIIRKMNGKIPVVKILGQGQLTKALTIEGCKISKQAKEKIEKSGGKIL